GASVWVVLEAPARRVTKASRHPEVNQENATALEPKNQILAATLDGDDLLAFELGCDLARLERADEPRVVDLDADESVADECRLELSADGLDLGQLRHRASVAMPCSGAAPRARQIGRASCRE